jgi:hypothetical protein
MSSHHENERKRQEERGRLFYYALLHSLGLPTPVPYDNPYLQHLQSLYTPRPGAAHSNRYVGGFASTYGGPYGTDRCTCNLCPHCGKPR